MPSRARHIGPHHRQRLTSGWCICSTLAGTVAAPADVPESAWQPIAELAPVAAALRANGTWTMDGDARRFDAEEWWYRLEFDLGPAAAGELRLLEFDGLATVCDAWLDGRELLTSTNMFLSQALELGDDIKPGTHELVLRFRALDTLLAQRKPRPRWRTPMVEHQQLRWWRTTLLGRTPGWSPPATVLGPWRDITLVHRRVVDVRDVRISAKLGNGRGVLALECLLLSMASSTIEAVTLELERDGAVAGSVRMPVHADGRCMGRLEIANPELWWPHTHGTPALYAARLKGQVAESAFEIDLGSLGFRDVQLDTTDGRFALRINGVPVFCRGACWTPPDPVNLDTPAADSLAMLERVRDAGLNMVRVGGTMVYENDAFLDACDALGIMVWQDFMFANMDYPGDDENFLASVQAEATQELARWQARPCMAVLCGNSEVEQQAAMWGAPRDAWTSPLFHEHLAQLAHAWLPDVPYWPSSAHGGAFAHQGDQGSTSYYGVGAYLRDYSDARTSEVAFATECLAFANIPHDAALSRMPGGVGVRVHHPGWKQRSPRDLGAGWDFDDVRDHYLAQEFKIDPVRLRYSDPDRYVMLGRIATGTAMAAAFAQWRRPASRCGGALVWFLRDLWAGAGWGLFDDRGVPKSCLHMIAPLLAPVAVWFTDEGGNGVAVHVANDRGEPICGELELIVLRPGGAVLVQARKRLDLEAHGSRTVNAAEWFDEFIDLAYAYRFGPAGVEAVVANLLGATGERLAQGFFFPGACADSSLREPELAASARLIDGSYLVTVSSQHIARAVHFEVEGHEASAEYFNIAPGEQRDVIVRALPGHTRPLRGSVRALNSALRAPLKVQA